MRLPERPARWRGKRDLSPKSGGFSESKRDARGIRKRGMANIDYVREMYPVFRASISDDYLCAVIPCAINEIKYKDLHYDKSDNGHENGRK